MSNDERMTAAMVAAAEAHSTLLAANAAMVDASFNLADLDAVVDAAEALQIAVRNVKAMRYRLEFQQELAADRAEREKMDEVECYDDPAHKARVQAALDAHTSRVVGLTERAMARPVDGGEHADEAPHLPRTSFLEGA